MDFVEEVLKAEAEADRILEDARQKADVVREETRRQEMQVLEEGRREGNQVFKQTVEKLVKVALVKAEQTSSSQQTETSQTIKQARSRIPDMVKTLVKEVEKA
ncbi:MAG TPA: hypothetical protein ENN60_01960 [archaeon]|nr:hypothetical protein [archaeon]